MGAVASGGVFGKFYRGDPLVRLSKRGLPGLTIRLRLGGVFVVLPDEVDVLDDLVTATAKVMARCTV